MEGEKEETKREKKRRGLDEEEGRKERKRRRREGRRRRRDAPDQPVHTSSRSLILRRCARRNTCGSLDALFPCRNGASVLPR